MLAAAETQLLHDAKLVVAFLRHDSTIKVDSVICRCCRPVGRLTAAIGCTFLTNPRGPTWKKLSESVTVVVIG